MIKKYTAIFIILFVINTTATAQRAREIQLSDEPIIWSDPWSIALYIVFPIFLVVSSIYLRYRFKRRQREKE
jgi:hypothetical protein